MNELMDTLLMRTIDAILLCLIKMCLCYPKVFCNVLFRAKKKDFVKSRPALHQLLTVFLCFLMGETSILSCFGERERGRMGGEGVCIFMTIAPKLTGFYGFEWEKLVR